MLCAVAFLPYLPIFDTPNIIKYASDKDNIFRVFHSISPGFFGGRLKKNKKVKKSKKVQKSIKLKKFKKKSKQVKKFKK